MDRHASGAGQQQLDAHQHSDRVGRVQHSLEARQVDSAHPQPGEHLMARAVRPRGSTVSSNEQT